MTKHFFFLFTSVYNVGPHFNHPLNLGSQYQTNFKILTYFFFFFKKLCSNALQNAPPKEVVFNPSLIYTRDSGKY